MESDDKNPNAGLGTTGPKTAILVSAVPITVVPCELRARIPMILPGLTAFLETHRNGSQLTQ